MSVDLNTLENRCLNIETAIEKTQKYIEEIKGKLLTINNEKAKESIIKCQKQLDAEYEKLVASKNGIHEEMKKISEVREIQIQTNSVFDTAK